MLHDDWLSIQKQKKYFVKIIIILINFIHLKNRLQYCSKMPIYNRKNIFSAKLLKESKF